MIKTGKQKKAIAIKEGNVLADGTSFITVIVDGGCSHRSYGYRYSANVSVACKLFFTADTLRKLNAPMKKMKNYTKALIKRQGLSNNVKDIVSVKLMKRLVKSAGAAIIHNSKNARNFANLRDDLKNGPFHVLGIHANCKTYFCTSTSVESALEEDYGDTCQKLDLDPEELEKKSQEVKKNYKFHKNKGIK
ncbi:hypothetical protein RN001_007855 [Aquatica leii]|uniref:Uncharacterized protein n=1 Tax=Aquatica leii TaxID=1421715 RepID=A0AAN7PWY1_9COLE|nr:hypothetical protein RN001_007855 [Aquatica leii]